MSKPTSSSSSKRAARRPPNDVSRRDRPLASSSLSSKDAPRRLTEEQLIAKGLDRVTPEDVLSLGRATETFLCPTDAEQIIFTKFRVRDMDSNHTLFEVDSPPDARPEDEQQEATTRADREVHYVLPTSVLRLERLGAFIEFRVGPEAVRDFRMVEVHYFGDRRLKAFDFNFGFCIPNSVNTCEHIYELPKLDETTIAAMVANPKATMSDSFYFANGKLFMHNKCAYTYFEPSHEEE